MIYETNVMQEALLGGLVDILDSVREHVTVFDGLAVPLQVSFSPKSVGTVVSLQLSGGGELPSLSARLLGWAATLTDVTVRAWYASPSSLHLYVLGRLTDGLIVQVWGGVDLPAGVRPVQGCDNWRTDIDHGLLHAWAALGEVAA